MKQQLFILLTKIKYLIEILTQTIMCHAVEVNNFIFWSSFWNIWIFCIFEAG